MSERKAIPIEFAYTAMGTQGRERNPWQILMRATASVFVREVPASEAPVAVSAEWPDGGRPSRMAWRAHDGVLWRPVVGPGGEPLDTSGAFERLMARGASAEGLGHARDWVDYPFRHRETGNAYHGRSPFIGGSRHGEPGLRVQSDGREAALSEAYRTAKDDLLLIDGVMHMRSRPPVWAVGRRDWFWESPGQVRLILPDFPEHDDRLATFPLDRYEEAVAFAEANVGRIEGLDWVEGARPRSAPEPVAVQEAKARVEGFTLPDTRADDLRRLFENVEQGFSKTEFGRLPRGFVKAFGYLGVVVDAIDGAGPGTDWTDRMEEAMRAFVAAGEKEWGKMDRHCGEQVERMRSLVLRGDLAARRDFEEDVAGLAGLRP